MDQNAADCNSCVLGTRTSSWKGTPHCCIDKQGNHFPAGSRQQNGDGHDQGNGSDTTANCDWHQPARGADCNVDQNQILATGTASSLEDAKGRCLLDENCQLLSFNPNTNAFAMKRALTAACDRDDQNGYIAYGRGCVGKGWNDVQDVKAGEDHPDYNEDPELGCQAACFNKETNNLQHIPTSEVTGDANTVKQLLKNGVKTRVQWGHNNTQSNEDDLGEPPMILSRVKNNFACRRTVSFTLVTRLSRLQVLAVRQGEREVLPVRQRYARNVPFPSQ